MNFLVKTATGRGGDEWLETLYQDDVLSLGDGSENTVQLFAMRGRLRFKPNDAGGAHFTASGGKVTVNGKSTRRARLSVGDTVQACGYQVLLLEPPPGFDLAIQLEREGDGHADGMELAGKVFSMRWASWISAMLVLILCLVIPATVLVWPNGAEILSDGPLPDDGIWSSGPLDSAHAIAGVAEDCQACHEEPFVMVEDRACLRCHREIKEHVDIGTHAAEQFSGVRCASCHREHNEPGTLVRRDNGLCVDCHAEPGELTQDTERVVASAFTAEDHPAFTLGLLTPKGKAGALGWELVEAGHDETLRERSNLKFNHAIHLNEEKVHLHNSGDALHCNSCHVAEDDGEHFEPITMNKICRDCHKLNFDTFEPELELPHGDLRAAIVALEAHFIREFTDPVLRRQRAARKVRRVPGKREAAATCDDTGLECGRAEARKEASFQFGKTGCITCHEVIETDSEHIMDRWVVHPVRIAGDWLRASRFDHASHQKREAVDPDAVCLECHAADDSVAATDVLIPHLDNCLTCHNEERGATAVNCVGCHEFHQPWGSAAASARGLGTPGHAASNHDRK